MDVAVKQLRWKALNALVRAHKPGTLQLPFLASTLGFLMPDTQSELESTAAADGSDPQQQQQQLSPSSSRGSPGARAQQLAVQLAALTIDDQGKLLPGCSDRSCSGENAPAQDRQEGLQACLEWCQRHGAVFDSEEGGCSMLMWQLLYVCRFYRFSCACSHGVVIRVGL